MHLDLPLYLVAMETRRTASGESSMSTFSSGETVYDFVGTTQTFTSKLAAISETGTRWSERSRIWLPHPNSKRARTLVLCFDGTGDQFDSDVSFRLRSHVISRHLLMFNVSELERRPACGHAEERRYGQATRLLPGNRFVVLFLSSLLNLSARF